MLLEVKNLNKKFGSVTAAKSINFKMDANDIIGVIGSNGAGKTTFCNMITGYLKPDSGEILYQGKNITKFNIQKIKNIGIHRSFQIPQIFENLGLSFVHEIKGWGLVFYALRYHFYTIPF